MSDVGVVVQAGEVLINDVKNKNLIALIGDLKTFVNSFKNALHDCFNTTSTEETVLLGINQEEKEVYVQQFSGFLDCISDIKNKIVPDISNFIQVAKTKDIGQIINALVSIQADLKLTLAECGLSQTHLEAHVLTFNPLECLSDVSQLVTLGQTIISNFQSRSFETLIQNIYQLVNLVPKAISACTSFNSTMTLQARQLELSTDIFKCIADVQDEVSEVQALIASVQSGLNISDVIPRIQHLIVGLNNLEKDCGISNQTTQFTFDPEHCIADVSNTIAAATNLINDYNAGNLVNLIQDVSGLIQEVRALSADCLSQNLTNFVEIGNDKFDPVVCLNYGYDIYTSVQQIVTDYNNQSFPQLLTDVIRLVGDVEGFALECLSINITQTLNFDPQECLRDVLVLSEHVEILVEDAKAGNYSRLVQDVAVILQNVQGISADCLSTQLSFKNNLKFNPISCIHDVTLLVPLLNETISDVESGNFIKVVQDIAQLNQLFVNVKADCLSNSSDFNIVANPNSCAQDVFGLVSLAEKILVDAESKNYGQLIVDVQSLIHLANIASSDCFNSTFALPAEELEQRLNLNPSQCLNDVLGLVPVLQSIVGDAQNKDFAKLLQDFLQAVPLLKGFAGDCLDYNVSFVDSCVVDAKTFALDGVELIKKLHNNTGDISYILDLMARINQLKQDGERVSQSCHVNLTIDNTFEKILNQNNQVNFLGASNEESGCWTNLRGLSNLLYKVYNAESMMLRMYDLYQVKEKYTEVKTACLGGNQIEMIRDERQIASPF